MKKANDTTNQFQFDLFKPPAKADNLNQTDNLNKDCPSESNLQEDNHSVEKTFDYSIGTNNNSVKLTYIDYDCPQAKKAHETVSESLNRLTKH